MEGQDKFIMRELDNTDGDLREDCEEDLADVGCNADLCVANQNTDLTHEVHVGDALFAFNGSSQESRQDVFHFCSLSLD